MDLQEQDYIFDSRKSAYVREYNLNLYPLDVAKTPMVKIKMQQVLATFICSV